MPTDLAGIRKLVVETEELALVFHAHVHGVSGRGIGAELGDGRHRAVAENSVHDVGHSCTTHDEM